LFSSLVKSKVAARKADRLSQLETALLDMAVSAAFMQPDHYLSLIDTAECTINNTLFKLYVVQIECAVLSLVVPPVGPIGLTDFVLTRSLVEIPAGLAG
jgi:hypothetical protein